MGRMGGRCRGGTTSLRSCVIACNNHMTILHSSFHKYVHIVHDLHCILRYISIIHVEHTQYNKYSA